MDGFIIKDFVLTGLFLNQFCCITRTLYYVVSSQYQQLTWMLMFMLWYLLSRPFLFFQRKLIAILVSIVCSIARKFNFIPFRKIFNLATNLLLIITISLIAPFWMRRFFYSNFVEHEKPLEFVFNTCTIELSGVCSFPEAEFVLDPVSL